MIIVLLAALFLADIANAATYYVSTTGSNSNDGLTVDTPKLTVAHTVALMVAGDTTYVRGGTYNENSMIRFGVSGTAAAPIKLLNYPGETPVISCANPATQFMLIQNFSGSNVAMAYLTIEGFEITNCYLGIKWYNLADSVIRRNWIHHNPNGPGLLGGGARILVEKNIINGNGKTIQSNHGIYGWGHSWTIINNVIYDSWNRGIQVNGLCSNHACYNASEHAGPEFAAPENWIISDNTFAYSLNRGAIVVYGNEVRNLRIENNIFYENCVTCGTSAIANGIEFNSSLPTNVQIRNNHAYASGSGSQIFISSGSAVENTHYTQSGNVVNVSAPAFVNGGSNSLPASPDFRLTASSPVNICLGNEFLNNSTCVVGAFKTVANPTASIHGNTMVWTFPMSTAVPIQIPSATGFSIGCTGTNCPGSPTVGSALQKPSTDSQVNVVVNGIAGDACVNTNQNWTGTYNSATGSWTGFDNIGPYPGLHQKIFSFTSLAVTNLCDGTSTGGGVGTPLITYKFDEGTGTLADNTGSSGATDDGTLANGAGWTTGKTGSAVNITGGTQQVQVPYGSGVNPSTQSMTWAIAINVPSGSTSAARYDVGGQIGSSARAYFGAAGGTWRVGVQGTSISAAGASNLTVDAGWNHLCINWNSSTDTVTLYKNGVAGTGGATRAYTSFTMPSDVLIGITGTGFPAAMTPGAYDDFLLYESVEDCSAIYADWNASTTSIGTFGMPASRFQSVYLTELGGSPTTFGTAINQAKDVVAGGAVAVLLEWQCQTGADCEQDAVRPEARHTAALPFTGAESWLQIPDTENDTHIYMWGQDTNTLLNSGATTSRLSAGSCTVTNGVTLLTSAQVPVVDLPDGGCVVLRYIVRLGATASGYYDIRLSRQNGTAFAGTVNPARINVIGPQGSAF